MLKDKEINGISFGSTNPHVAHLISADDSIVFLQPSNGNFVTLNISSLTTSGPRDKWEIFKKPQHSLGSEANRRTKLL